MFSVPLWLVAALSILEVILNTFLASSLRIERELQILTLAVAGRRTNVDSRSETGLYSTSLIHF